MSLSSLNLMAIRDQVAKLKQSGAVTMHAEAPQATYESATPIEIRTKTASKWVEDNLDIDFAAISAALGLDLNKRIRPLILKGIIRKRLAEMQKDGLHETIPQIIWELLRSIMSNDDEMPLRKVITAEVKKRGEGFFSVKCQSANECKELVAYRPFSTILSYTAEWWIEESEINISGGFLRGMQTQTVQAIVASELGYYSAAGSTASH